MSAQKRAWGILGRLPAIRAAAEKRTCACGRSFSVASARSGRHYCTAGCRARLTRHFERMLHAQIEGSVGLAPSSAEMSSSAEQSTK